MGSRLGRCLIDFEWDDAKAAANLAKHGVDFLDAAQIFLGRTVEAPDDRRDYGERRMRALGRHDGETYLVVYTRRQGAIRLISAERQGEMTGSTMTRLSLDELRGRKGETRSDAPEAPDLDAGFWEKATLVEPRGKTSIHLRIDADVLDFFKSEGKGHLTRMNTVLRSYMDAQRKAR